MTIKLKDLEYHSLAETAAAAGVSRQTLWRWRQERKIPRGRLYRGRQVLYTAAEVAEIERYATRIEPIDPIDSSPGGSTIGAGAPGGET